MSVRGSGRIGEAEYVFDIYTKLYDFVGTDVNVLNAQDLWEFYGKRENLRQIKHKMTGNSYNEALESKGTDTNLIPHASYDKTPYGRSFTIYSLIEYFIENHPYGHFIIDECPILETKCCKCCLNY